jgi:uncharacterized protein
MSETATLLLPFVIFVMALLYSSVGHAGASGYLAAMALFGIAPLVMRPAALTLNILVATIATVQFYRAGCFSWRILLPFAAASAPLAFVGGMITLPGVVYKQAVGVVLLFAAYKLFRYRQGDSPDSGKPIPIYFALLFGGGIGLLSGLTGVGGGIFLSPLLRFMGWAETRQTSGVAAAFILVNSIAGLLGNYASVRTLPGVVLIWGVAAVAGGLIGSELGRRRLATITLRRVLAAVLVIAGLKLMFA